MKHLALLVLLLIVSNTGGVSAQSAYNSNLVLPEVGALTTLMDTVAQW